MISEKMTPVKLTDQGLWLLYRATCCEIMEQNGLTKDVIGCDLWEFTSSLDMSFDDIKNKHIEHWPSIIKRDVEEFKSDTIVQH